MAKYVVKQSGPLRGEVFISGAKNAVLPLMAAALLSEEECIIRDVPMLRDVAFMKDIFLLILLYAFLNLFADIPFEVQNLIFF